jgi:hypothetical protein
MRTNYRDLPHTFAFMTSLPPPSLRIYIVEVSEPHWEEQVQDVYTNIIIPSQDRFTIYPENRFHDEKFSSMIRLHMSDRNSRTMYPEKWWFTGFILQNTGPRRTLHEVPLLDFQSRIIQDLLFQQSRPVTIIHSQAPETIYRTVLQKRLNILSMIPHEDVPFPYMYDENLPRRRLSFTPQTPPRTRRRYTRDDDYHHNSQEIGGALRQSIAENRMVQPPPPTQTVSFTLPKFVAQAMIQSHIQTDKTCSITMTPFKDIRDIAITSCYHCFDQEALTRWMIENQTCPECRNQLEGTTSYRNEH